MTCEILKVLIHSADLLYNYMDAREDIYNGPISFDVKGTNFFFHRLSPALVPTSDEQLRCRRHQRGERAEFVDRGEVHGH